MNYRYYEVRRFDMSNERSIQETPCNENHCDVTAFQEIDVCVPITVEPYVDLGEPIIECIEEPCLLPIPCDAWNKKSKCKFTICQKLNIMIPIEFKAETCSGPPSVSCLGSEEEEEEDAWPPYICCETQKKEKHPPVNWEDEKDCKKICCEKGENSPELHDFYYFVRGRLGKLKKYNR
jgi:hypothetical protein